MSETTEPVPCKGCGNRPEVTLVRLLGWNVYCHFCRLTIPLPDAATREFAIECWNREQA